MKPHFCYHLCKTNSMLSIFIKQIWRCISGSTAGWTTWVLRGNDSAEPGAKTHHEEGWHMLLHEHHKRGKLSFCRSSKSKQSERDSTKGRWEGLRKLLNVQAFLLLVFLWLQLQLKEKVLINQSRNVFLQKYFGWKRHAAD